MEPTAVKHLFSTVSLPYGIHQHANGYREAQTEVNSVLCLSYPEMLRTTIYHWKVGKHLMDELIKNNEESDLRIPLNCFKCK